MKHIRAFIYSLFLTLDDMLFDVMLRTGMVLQMASTAISAQGTTLQIGTGSGGAKNITAIAVGYPTVLTSAAHGFGNGDVVAVAGVTGADAALINGFSLVVKYKTTNTYAVELDSTGKTLTATGTATPNTYTAVKNLNTFSGFDGQASELDKTNLDSTAKEVMLGLVDYGQISLSLDMDNADAGQIACRAAYVAGTTKLFKLTLPNTNVASFSGLVKQFGIAGGVDKIVEVPSLVIRVTGPITWA